MTSSTSKKASPMEEITLDAILDILAERIADRLSGRADATGAEPEPDEDETEEQEADEEDADETGVEDEYEVEDEYDDWSDDDLREEAIKRGFSEDEVGVADRDGAIDMLRADDRGEVETDGEEEEEEEEEPEEDEETDPREQLEHLSVRQLRKRARVDYGLTDDDIRGLDRDALIDLMLGETEEDEQAEEEEEEEPEEEEEEAEEYTIDDLTALPRKELLAQAKAYGVSVRPRAKAEDIAEAIMEAANTA
jgi:hypothetical protein